MNKMYNQCSFASEGPLEWKDEYHTPFVCKNLIATIAINSFSFPFTIIFNFLLIVGILLRRKLRRQKCMSIITYLAFTDLTVGVALQPIFLAKQVCQLSGFCTQFCALDAAFAYLNVVCCASSILHLVLIAWERYIAVKHALRYKVIVTNKKIILGTIIAWFIALVFGIRVFLGEALFIYRMVILSPLITFSLSIVYCYTIILLESMRHRRQIQANIPQELITELERNKEFRGAKTATLVFCCLILCYGPIVIIFIIYSVGKKTKSPDSNLFCITCWAQILVMLNSLCNPLIYGWRLKKIRTSIKRFLKCCPWKVDEQSNETTIATLKKPEPSRSKKNPDSVCPAINDWSVGGNYFKRKMLNKIDPLPLNLDQLETTSSSLRISGTEE